MRTYTSKLMIYLITPILALALNTACSGTSQSKMLTYKNEAFGYSIDYPKDWRVEVADKGKTCLLSPTSPSLVGSLMIYVIPSVPVNEAVQKYKIAMATQWEELTLYDDNKLEGQWDWNIYYGWETNQGYEFMGQAFFKYTPQYIYRVDTAAPSLEYDEYPFDAIVSSFKLL